MTAKETSQTFILKSDLKQLPLARKEVAKVADELGFSNRDSYDLQVAVCEAVANGIEHGEGKPIRLKIKPCEDSLVLTITSEGKFKRRMPGRGEDNCRGRGIFLMLALVDSVDIQDKDDRVTVSLTKKLPTENLVRQVSGA